jgi:hypothetical protein
MRPVSSRFQETEPNDSFIVLSVGRSLPVAAKRQKQGKTIWYYEGRMLCGIAT